MMVKYNLILEFEFYGEDNENPIENQGNQDKQDTNIQIIENNIQTKDNNKNDEKDQINSNTEDNKKEVINSKILNYTPTDFLNDFYNGNIKYLICI